MSVSLTQYIPANVSSNDVSLAADTLEGFNLILAVLSLY